MVLVMDHRVSEIQDLGSRQDNNKLKETVSETRGFNEEYEINEVKEKKHSRRQIK